MRKPIVIGQRFGRLLVVCEDRIRDRRSWKCLCDCGTEKVITDSDLKTGRVNSCGCLQKELLAARCTKHGHSKNRQRTLTLSTYKGMITRCSNPNVPAYPDYGGRGITICDRWRESFENFLEDMGERTQGMTLDRIDNDGNYCPKNCRWVTRKEQNRNKRNSVYVTYKGETKNLSEWAEYLGIAYKTLHDRLYRYKWDVHRSFTTPVSPQ